MSFFGDAWDLVSGQNKFQPTAAPIQAPVTNEQANQAQATSKDAIAQQAAFVQALQAQNGIQNQSQVYNQLQGVANGTGPNPAQAMLNNATGANVAQTAALMAGQRGGNANAGLIARQAGQQGAQIQQNAAGQGAALQAQQSLNAIGQAGQIAGQQVGQQAGAIGGLNTFAQNEQGMLLNSIANANSVRAGAQANLNTIGSGIAQHNAEGQAKVIGQGLNAAGAALGLANGGQVPGPSSKAAQIYINGAPAMFEGGQAEQQPVQGEMLAAKGKMVPGKAKVKGDSLKNDNVKALLSPGEIVIPRSIAQSKDAPKKAADFVAAILMKSKRK